MTFEDYVRQQGIEDRYGTLYDQDGRRVRQEELIPQLRAQYEQLMRPDASGRAVHGTELGGYANNLRGGEGLPDQQQVVTVNGKQYVRLGSSSVQDILGGLQRGSHPWIAKNAARYLQGLKDSDFAYDPRYGYGIEKGLYDQTLGKLLTDAPNSGKGGMFGPKGVMEAFSNTIGPVMGVSNLAGMGLNHLAAGGSELAGSFLPEGGYQSLYSGLSGGGDPGVGSYWDEAGNMVNGGAAAGSYWDEAGNLATNGAGAGLGAVGAGAAGAGGEAGAGTGVFSTLASNVLPAVAGAAVGAAAAGLAGGSGGGGVGGGPDYTNETNLNDASLGYAKNVIDQDLAFREQFWNDSKARRDALLRFAGGIAEQQLGFATESGNRARDQWNTYQNTFRPVEISTAVDSFGGQYLTDAEAEQLSRVLTAQGIDPADRQRQAYALSKRAEERAGGQAATRAVAGSNAATAQAMRAVQRMGGDPQRFAAAAADLATRDALVRADAGNRAREGVRDRGVGLRSNAANFGLNIANSAGQHTGLAVQAGSNAVTNAQTAANSELPFAQFRVGGTPAAIAGAGLGQQGALGLASIKSRDYGNSLNYALGDRKLDADDDDSFIGTLLGIGNLGLKAYGAGLFG